MHLGEASSVTVSIPFSSGQGFGHLLDLIANSGGLGGMSRSLFRQGKDLDLNFSHPLTAEQCRQSRSLFRQGKDLDPGQRRTAPGKLGDPVSIPFSSGQGFGPHRHRGNRNRLVESGLDPFFVRARIWTVFLNDNLFQDLLHKVSIPFSSGQGFGPGARFWY